ncbi:MAG: zinc metalloprotease [Bacteroidota bacterium]
MGSTAPLFSQDLYGTDGYMEEYHLQSIEFQLAQQFFEQRIAHYRQNNGLRSENDADTVIQIKVAVNIVYSTEEENFSDYQVDEQIETTNFDLRLLNANLSDRWPQAADTKIELVLDTIIRRKTYRTLFSKDNSMKNSARGGINPQPTDQYLNIWVCNLFKIIGYATQPGTSADVDGIVIDYRSFGVNSLRPGYNLGHTLTHELGHYLGLYHTFHGGCEGGDQIDDTPATSQANYGCQEDLLDCDGLVMVENFMDQSLDECVSIFTEGQKERMRSYFANGGARRSLLDINTMDSTIVKDPPIITCTKPEEVIHTNTNNVLELFWDSSEGENFLFEFKLAASNRWFSMPARNDYLRLQGIQSTWSYTIRFTKICPNGGKSDPIEINHGNAFNRTVPKAPLKNISIYDFSGRYHGELTIQEYRQRHEQNAHFGLPQGIYALVKRDVNGRYLGTEKWAILNNK